MTTTTKTKTVSRTARYFRTDTWNPPANPSYSVNSNIVRTRTGANLLHFKDRIRNHQDATTALDGTYMTLYSSGDTSVVASWHQINKGQTPPPGENGWEAHWPRRTARIDGDYSPTNWSAAPSDVATPSWIDGRASNKFLSKVRDEQQAVSMPSFIGEFHQTWNMLRRPAGALWDNINGYYRALRKRKSADPKNWLYAVPGLWLEYSFGWLPLFQDIDGGWKAMNRLLEQTYTKHVSASATGGLKISENHSYAVPYDSLVSGLRRDWHEFTNGGFTIRYRGDMVVQAATTFKDKAAQWGFSPSEFLPTAWELLPWSFLADYFVSIGDYLDASATNTADVRWVAKTEIREIYKKRVDVTNVAATISAIGALPEVSGSSSFAVWTRKTVKRRSASVPTPSVYVKVNGPSAGHFANMSALFGQFCRNLHYQNPTTNTFRNYRGS